jgi:hypothetical protein
MFLSSSFSCFDVNLQLQSNSATFINQHIYIGKGRIGEKRIFTNHQISGTIKWLALGDVVSDLGEFR